MTDCIFCKIINGEIPSAKVYEDDEVYAFLDITQVTKGHTLVIPKKHVKNIFEYDSDLACSIFSRIPKIANAIQDSLPGVKGMNILNNNGEIAYQSVFHSHIHLIPRYQTEEGFKLSFTDNSKSYTNDEFQQLAASIKKTIESVS
ncbi:HIT family protein [Facklamia miroungae]|uniref:Histidine triad (HIT) family protein n=1 Tax=Facklamia miroungae TaxID=120956 RepID=A0A1G7QUV2_9LACT|nr:HIT family protein [Facklamia miroungae]NKZ29075.1 HIT family protein [Facklamia miroungae]SDG02311.1 histidine triad (HIT) family protein [Facklamia miroungae]